MESMYQRGKIQEESLHYETLKDNGSLPIIGVNTYISENIEEQLNTEIELSRCTDEEKIKQIERLKAFQDRNKSTSKQALADLRAVALRGDNIFEELLNTTKFCSLGQISEVLYEVGGRYRRNM